MKQRSLIRILVCTLIILCLPACCLAEVPAGIICWGDSLTQGAGGEGVNWPQVLKDTIQENLQMEIPVINMGVGGEDTLTILGRSGVIPFVTAADFTIPSSKKTSVSIAIQSASGAPVTPLRQGKAGMEDVWIKNIGGRIRVKQDSPYEGEFSYRFNRYKKGKKVYVPAGTEIITSGSRAYLDYLPIIFMGQNGGYADTQELIEQIRMLAGHHTDGRFLVIGIASGTDENRSEMESDLEQAFGRQYINLRQYMITQALADAGIEPTQADLERMEAGSTPPSLHASEDDLIHFNAAGYELIGKLVYARMEELGYLE